MDKSKNFVIGALLCAIVIMSVGYALLAQTLTINGTGKIDAAWDVHFKDDIAGSFVKASNIFENDIEKVPTSSGTTATFYALLKEPGAKATYTVTVENSGTIDAKLESITDLTGKNAEDPTAIIFTVSGITENETLAAGATKVVTVTVEWPASETEIPETKEKTVSIALNFVQA